MVVMIRNLLLIVVGIAVCGIHAAGAGEPKPAEVRKIPGLTGKDPFPRGCVDCHVNMPERKMDVRISTLMKRWQEKVEPEFLARVKMFTPSSVTVRGKHPRADAALADIPNACLKCHSKTSTFAPPLGPLLHGLHFTGGEKNHFLTLFQGECTHCHKFDAKSGNWGFASGKEP